MTGLKIISATDNEAFDAWLEAADSPFVFLQSSVWARALRTAGRTVELIRILDGDAVVAQALLDWRALGFGYQYAFCPKGPVIMNHAACNIEHIYEALTGYVKSKNCIFLRIEPSLEIRNLKFEIRIVKDINPPATLLLDLATAPDALLNALHPKTRYNIRLAEKKVRVEVAKSFKIFWDLLQKTGERDNFNLHPKNSYQAILESPSVEQLIAYVGDMPVATGVFIRFGNVVNYLYGASDHNYRAFMAPYLVQWTAILRARESSARTYDFFGIAPSSPTLDSRLLTFVTTKDQSLKTKDYRYDPRHRYAGVTRFKLGFGGTVYEDPGTFDVIIYPVRHWLYQLIRKFRLIF